MLSSISWQQFGVFILLGLVVYYGYVLVTYYRAEFAALLRGKPRGDVVRVGLPEVAVEEKTEGTGGVLEEADGGGTRHIPETSAGAVGLFPDSGPETLFEGDGTAELAENTAVQQGVLFAHGEADLGGMLEAVPEQYHEMQRVAELLREKIGEASARRMEREELEGAVQEILSPYRHLEGTGYGVSINNVLVRGCRIRLGIELSKEDLRRLWGGGGDGLEWELKSL